MGVALSYDNKKFYAEMLTVTDFRLRNKRHPDKFWTSTRPTITSTWMTLMTMDLGPRSTNWLPFDCRFCYRLEKIGLAAFKLAV